MKDLLLVDSGIPLEFWAEVIDTTNYLRKKLPTKSQRRDLIPKIELAGKKQDVSHIKVFGNVISVLIPKVKRHKSDIYKNWERMFIEFSPDITKHFCAWTLNA